MFNPLKVNKFPEKPGVYLMKDIEGKIIYVGKAINLKNRVKSYFRNKESLSPKVRAMVSQIEDIEFIVTESDLEALVLECNLIKFHKPKYNILLRDDKQYPYIKINLDAPYPYLEIVRRIKKDGAKYFGPFVDAGALRETIDAIRKIFPIRYCSKDLSKLPLKERPCLNYHIKKCLAPCKGGLPQGKYMEMVENIILFLEGKTDLLVNILKEKMFKASEALDFETAAEIKEKLISIEKVRQKQHVVTMDLKNKDIIGYFSFENIICLMVLFVREGKLIERRPFIFNDSYQNEPGEVISSFIKQFYDDMKTIPEEIILPENIEDKDVVEEWLCFKKGAKVKIVIAGENSEEDFKLISLALENAKEYVMQKRLWEKKEECNVLEELKQKLSLQKLPFRIEGFDISNTGGTDSVASMVVFEGGLPKKQDYRRFKIKTVEGPNDFESMKEVIYRRFNRAKKGDEKFGEIPDLLLIDGGPGQLKYAKEALKELGFNEKIEVISIAKELELIYKDDKDPIELPKTSEALKLLQRIRDEAHRFAVTFHRNIRAKRNMDSVLDSIPGIGEKRKKALLQSFPSIEEIKNTSIEELARVPGMNKKAAKAVYNYFHSVLH
ncbi:excinuclease ABC subunit UvrC [Thermovenabulum gondwanense]|uniref:UvrABC system protein C n=1 Tax=Thermovenabulum gondwanense TaxID=520767 RepID=A0A162MCU8_9FIRM|nr:excinuclease ABC subunit UvrC [Thermovenabulum gondwanense]KYO65276.1 UvrABC system protein C [Thermovenabulum gondwanense]